jgi:proteasome lid subunit RPN8/RPN11
MIEIDAHPWQTMVLHAERTYPNECCGAMLGHTAGDIKRVTEALPLENVFAGSQNQRYEVRTTDLMRAEKLARDRGLDVLGIFHSHPDSDPYFSENDLQNSCPWYSFVVISVHNGAFSHAKSFLPDANQTRADDEDLIWPKS